MEVSAKSNINIEKAFFSLASDIKKRIIDTASKEPTNAPGVAIGGPDANKGAMSNCC